MERYNLLVDGHHGVFVARSFAQGHDMAAWNVSELDAKILSCGIYWPDIIKELLECPEEEDIDRLNVPDVQNIMYGALFTEEFGENYLNDWSEIYWETWDSVLNTACFECEEGRYHLILGESGDLFVEKEMTDEELAEWIAQENGLDVEAFKVFCEEECYTLSDEYDAMQAVKHFQEKEI